MDHYHNSCGWYWQNIPPHYGLGSSGVNPNNLASDRFIYIRQYADSYDIEKQKYKDNFHNAIRVELNTTLVAGITYVMRMKIIPYSKYVLFEATGDNHLRVHFTQLGEEWNENPLFSQNQKFEAINANIVINSNTTCHWHQSAREFTVPGNKDKLKNLVLYVEEGAFGIDDVEIYEKCPVEMLIQNKFFASANTYLFLGFPMNYEAATTIKAGYNVGAPTSLGNVIINNGADVTFKAGNLIRLEPGFRAQKGCKFRATIGPCGGGGKWSGVDSSNSTTVQGNEETPEEPEPLTLTATPNLKQQTVTTEWTATALSAYDYFTVERSNHPPAPSLFKDGEGFSIVITVPGKEGVGEILQYEEVDKDPLYGISYYRVKQTGESGDFRFSNIATVKLLPPLAFSVRPNPATRFIEVTFGKIEKGTVYVLTPEYDARIFIFTASGQQVYEKSFNGTFYKYSIDVSALSQGLYFVTLIANDQLYKGKFVKE